jgi:drug/metabolite transporter (DMT)-like permease
VALVVIAAVLWSMLGLMLRQIEEAETWAVLFWRAAGSLIVLVGFVAWRSGGQPLAAIRRTGLAGLIGGVGLVIASAGAIFAIQNTTVANAAFLFAASPFLTALLGFVVLREDVRRGTWAAIAIALGGIVFMIGGEFSGGAMLGNVAALGSALGFAIFTVALRWGRLEDMVPAVVIGAVLSMVAAVPLASISGEALVALPALDIALSIGMGAVLFGVGMVLYTLGSRVVAAAELTLLTMVEVMLAPVWVWLFMGETATAGTFIGGGVILIAVVTNALTGMRRKPLAPPIS